jgi:hypothetical protein
MTAIERRFALLVAAALLSCTSEEEEGGPCTYVETPGTATVVTIGPPAANAYNCAIDPVDVRFDFVPQDASLTALWATNVRLYVGTGQNPNRAYILSKGFAEGNTLACVRQDIRKGACVPTLYRFPGVDFSDYINSCF